MIKRSKLYLFIINLVLIKLYKNVIFVRLRILNQIILNTDLIFMSQNIRSFKISNIFNNNLK